MLNLLKIEVVWMKRLLLVFVVLAVFLLAACSSPQEGVAVPPESDGGNAADTSVSSGQAGAGGVREFSITAKQWEFVPDAIAVKKGDTVRLSVKSVDVSHGMAIPDFGVNEVLQPGKTVNIEFVADKAGVFSFFCSVQCGSGHTGMRGSLVVE